MIKNVAFFGLLIIGLFITFFVQAQEYFIPGYIINNNDDTITGQINYRFLSNNPEYITFKSSTDSFGIKYKPSDIKEYSIFRKNYKSAYVEIDTTEKNNDRNKITESFNVETKMDSVFLQALILGEKSLFLHSSSTNNDNFYIKTDSSYQLLYYKKYKKKVNGETKYYDNKKYVGQLMVYLKSCPTLGTEISNTDYKKESLMRVFKNYHICMSEEPDLESKSIALYLLTNYFKADFGVLGGVTNSSITFIEESTTSALPYQYLLVNNYKNSINPTFGIFLSIEPNKSKIKYTVHNELLHRKYSFSSNFNLNYNLTDYSTYSFGFDYTLWNLNNILQLRKNIGNTFVYVSGGISHNFLTIDYSNYRSVEIVRDDITTTSTGRAFTTADYTMGYNLGAGIKYKNLFGEFRYESDNGMIDKDFPVGAKMNHYSIIVGYKLSNLFNKN